MNAKLCDRCGSFYGIRYTNVFEELAECLNVSTHTEELRRKMEADVDLCPDCSRELLKWLKGGAFECPNT